MFKNSFECLKIFPKIQPRMSQHSYTFLSGRPRTAVTLLGDKQHGERLFSQKGISFLRTSTGHGDKTRAIRDKRYFEGLIQIKVGEINAELVKLRGEIEQATRDQSASGLYEKRAKLLASELTESQRSLADLNICVEKLNFGQDSVNILASAKELADVNDAEVASLENLYNERVKLQETVKNLEIEKNSTYENFKKVESQMKPNEKKRYLTIKSKRDDLSKKIFQIKTEIEHFEKTKNSILTQSFITPEKKEQIELELEIYNLENRKDKIFKEFKSNLSPEEQKKELNGKMKEDKEQICAIQKATQDVKDQIKQLEISEDPKNTRNAKINDLKSKEKSIEKFLSSVDKMVGNEDQKLEAFQNEIYEILISINQKLKLVPTRRDFKSIFDDGDVEIEKLVVMERNLSRWDSKMKEEIEEMTREGILDVLALEESYDRKRVVLLKEKAELTSSLPMTKSLLQDATNCHEDIKKALVRNANFNQISDLEKRLVRVEESNWSIEEFLQDANVDDFTKLKTETLQLVERLNGKNKKSNE